MTDSAAITGGAGFVGLHLARALVTRGTEVVLIDDFSRGRADEELEALCELPGVTLVRQDLCAPLCPEMEALRPDHVFHLAAIVGVERVSERPDQVLELNVRALQQVLDWAGRVQARTFFFSSTSEVADGAVSAGIVGTPVPEDVPFVCPDLAFPRFSYAISKAYGEMLVSTAGRRHGLTVRIARFFNVYGPRMGNAHVIPQMIERGLRGDDPFVVPAADATRAFCFVDDAVRAVLALVDLPDPEPITVNVGDESGATTIGELAKRVLMVTGSESALESAPSPAGSPTERCPDTRRLRELTGFRPEVSLDEGLRRTFDWYRARALA